ncbi:MAG: hypothetical protein QNJ62_00865 [Methyloceanibacter sp.]|nr:hypothetical protein [Methyloceanibacter sp.]
MSDQKTKPEQEAKLKQEPMTVVDDTTIRENYANKLVATTFDGGALSITLGTTRFVPERIERDAEGKQSKAQVHVTSRLALSPVAAMELTRALTSMLGSLSKMAAQRAGEQTPEEGGPANTG